MKNDLHCLISTLLKKAKLKNINSLSNYRVGTVVYNSSIRMSIRVYRFTAYFPLRHQVSLLFNNFLIRKAKVSITSSISSFMARQNL